MAGIVTMALIVAVMKVHSSIQDSRSPLLLLPTSALPLTERDLKRALEAWTDRHHVLSLKAQSLKLAQEKGLNWSWAGNISSVAEVRAARDEAWTVVKVLRRAVKEVKEKEVRKMKVGHWITHKKNSRPTHLTTPPALYAIPLPLPEALHSDDYRLTVSLPAVESLPAYDEQAPAYE